MEFKQIQEQTRQEMLERLEINRKQMRAEAIYQWIIAAGAMVVVVADVLIRII